jgi:hypothetical protein
MADGRLRTPSSLTFSQRVRLSARRHWAQVREAGRRRIRDGYANTQIIARSKREESDGREGEEEEYARQRLDPLVSDPRAVVEVEHEQLRRQVREAVVGDVMAAGQAKFLELGHTAEDCGRVRRSCLRRCRGRA